MVTTNQNRRARLAQLLQKMPGETIRAKRAALRVRSGMLRATLSKYERRGFGEKAAASLEAAMDLPPRWFDQPAEDVAVAPAALAEPALRSVAVYALELEAMVPELNEMQRRLVWSSLLDVITQSSEAAPAIQDRIAQALADLVAWAQTRRHIE